MNECSSTNLSSSDHYYAQRRKLYRDLSALEASSSSSSSEDEKLHLLEKCHHAWSQLMEQVSPTENIAKRELIQDYLKLAYIENSIAHHDTPDQVNCIDKFRNYFDDVGDDIIVEEVLLLSSRSGVDADQNHVLLKSLIRRISDKATQSSLHMKLFSRNILHTPPQSLQLDQLSDVEEYIRIIQDSPSSVTAVVSKLMDSEWNVSLKDKELGLVLILLVVTKIPDLKVCSKVIQKYCETVLQTGCVDWNHVDTVLHLGDQLLSSGAEHLEMKERISGGLALIASVFKREKYFSQFALDHLRILLKLNKLEDMGESDETKLIFKFNNLIFSQVCWYLASHSAAGVLNPEISSHSTD